MSTMMVFPSAKMIQSMSRRQCDVGLRFLVIDLKIGIKYLEQIHISLPSLLDGVRESELRTTNVRLL